jgi:hypothetical protein
MSDRHELGKTICASCREGRLANATMWQGTARYWYCVACGWINRWTRVEPAAHD